MDLIELYVRSYIPACGKKGAFYTIYDCVSSNFQTFRSYQ